MRASEAADLACLEAVASGSTLNLSNRKGAMSPAGRSPRDEEIDEMHRILLKVAAHEMPSGEEIAFLREIKVEVLERFNGPSMRVDVPNADEPA
jgi:hypothetical protein